MEYFHLLNEAVKLYKTSTAATQNFEFGISTYH